MALSRVYISAKATDVAKQTPGNSYSHAQYGGIPPNRKAKPTLLPTLK